MMNDGNNWVHKDGYWPDECDWNDLANTFTPTYAQYVAMGPKVVLTEVQFVETLQAFFEGPIPADEAVKRFWLTYDETRRYQNLASYTAAAPAAVDTVVSLHAVGDPDSDPNKPARRVLKGGRLSGFFDTVPGDSLSKYGFWARDFVTGECYVFKGIDQPRLEGQSVVGWVDVPYWVSPNFVFYPYKLDPFGFLVYAAVMGGWMSVYAAGYYSDAEALVYAPVVVGGGSVLVYYAHENGTNPDEVDDGFGGTVLTYDPLPPSGWGTLALDSFAAEYRGVLNLYNPDSATWDISGVDGSGEFTITFTYPAEGEGDPIEVELHYTFSRVGDFLLAINHGEVVVFAGEEGPELDLQMQAGTAFYANATRLVDRFKVWDVPVSLEALAPTSDSNTAYYRTWRRFFRADGTPPS